ncbi:MAG: shikimate kinase [Fimbriimonadales bacterium]
MSVVLIGMMGAGKTTVGKQAARALGFRFADLDDIIEAAAGRSLSKIFACDGETAFREMETRALEELVGTARLVLSTGGGTPLRPGNLDLLRRIGVVIYLEASESLLCERLARGRKGRPLLADSPISETVRELLTQRSRVYEKADFNLRVDNHSLMDVALEVKSIAERMS